ncbi:MAG: MBL fold metallo-hydrolase [Actinobacteria bacterium]|nr:MBL fold metallo-hydrolase [Actinomycetota bacterium]
MQVTRWTHSCVRFEKGGQVLVVDPGVWTEPEALDGADVVLLTHEHGDHADLDRLGALGVRVVAPDGARLGRLAAERVGPGDTFVVNGFTVRTVGGTHLPVMPDQEPTPNLGYVVDDAVYHPGDALDVPLGAVPRVETLLVPMQASWLLTRAAVEFVRAVDPVQAVGIHDGQINERAVRSIAWWLDRETPCGFDWLAPGTALTRTG